MTNAFLFICLMVLVGVVLRQRVALFRWIFIPGSVIAGFCGLAVIQMGSNLDTFGLQNVRGVDAKAIHETTLDLSETLGSWPGFLIAIVFAGMLLERKPSPAKDSARRVGRQGLMVWVIVLGETAIGLLATWLLVQPLFNVPNSIGMLIETGFAGGHGTAGAMGEVFAHPNVNLPGGRDLGMLMATCGLVFGLISGIFWINIGVRKGWVSKVEKQIDDEFDQPPIGHARIPLNTLDPLFFQILWLALAFGIGFAMQSGVMQAAKVVDGWSDPKTNEPRAQAVKSNVVGQAMTATPAISKPIHSQDSSNTAQSQLAQRLRVSNIADFPLFIYTLFGGLILRFALSLFGQTDCIDGPTINRLTSTAMDILVVAAIASLNLQAVAAMLVPFSILFVCGCVWAAVCLLLISRWMLPQEHWFQLGLINYGMSTGTTATGFVLLRMIDPELNSGAAEDYALAAPLSAPFIGGGMITIALPLLVLEQVHIAVAALVTSTIVLVLIWIGRAWARNIERR